MNFAPRDTFLLTLCTTALLAGASQFVPDDGNMLGFHRVDVFSELRSDSAMCRTAGFDDFSFADNLSTSPSGDLPKEQPKMLTPPSGAPITNTAPTTATPAVANEVVPTDSVAKVEPVVQKSPSPAAPKTITAIEDFSSPTTASLSLFYDKLRSVNSLGRPVRIAVVGDSFIEGDIFTQDLREMMQSRFGGSGVGFVPLASTVAGFRQTVEHKFSGWTSHCITSNMRRGGYIISSYTYTPGDGSTVFYQGSKTRAHLQSFTRARLLFINRKGSKIKASVNGESEQIFTPGSSAELQQVVLMGDSIGSVRFTINSADGFTGYGAFLDASRGVSVDNYSVRGNSGVTLSSTDGDLMRQMNAMLPYDLIVFEYGLNVASADVRNYSAYLTQMQTAIAHLRKSFPSAAFLIMSVPDRARRTADGFATMPGIAAMAGTQRQLAEHSGAAYWSTLDAMQARGGMGEFVTKGWAAKDYTHLSHRGGKELARAFFDALMWHMENGTTN